MGKMKKTPLQLEALEDFYSGELVVYCCGAFFLSDEHFRCPFLGIALFITLVYDTLFVLGLVVFAPEVVLFLL